ncbi:polysaccharide deacetylase family protein [Nocardioides daeguensis]|uniref:NodB homology domain-containing protein n=1 Tax=Nocardioides daeguensis TaxID=908359 RepID=A0ABP6UWK8_9ACTN|nr:polysaccharide deacetylase family protein [Nocardioides daeguensis]MBV6725823.1 polysaccharide deacetylase family protein [Nocardioides daeguensis]MCR1772662.1 polysaccharide deacetylase family protein [Nocardioides daeguensis]
MHRPAPAFVRRLVAVLVTLLGVATASPAPAPAMTELPTLHRDKGCKGQVALTFDDGPSRRTTHRLVQVLRRNKVPATFFMVGQRVQAYPRVALEVERAGFLVANHSWAHRDMSKQSYPDVRSSLRATRRAMERAGLHPTGLMRPPYGALAKPARRAIRDAGYVPVLWTDDSLDWKDGSSQQIAARILAGLRPGRNIVLQHDGVNRSPISVGAVDRVIRVAKRRGFCFTALDERGRPGFPTPRVRVVAKDAVEGTDAVVSLELDQPAGRDTAVVVEAGSGTASVGSDLPAFRARVAVPAGSVKVEVRIPVSADAVLEPNETFTVHLRDPEGLEPAQEATPVTLVDAASAPRIDLPGPPFLPLGPKFS